jgi:hypothetical protein
LGHLREFHGLFSVSFFFAHGRHFSGKAILNAGHAKSVGQTKVPIRKNYLHFALSQSKPWEP